MDGDIQVNANVQPSLSVKKSSNKYLFLEVFCGSARLCHAMTQRSVPSLAIDYHRNASQPECFCLHLDLSADEGWEQLDDLSSAFTLVFFFAPPCGTASRAREIPIRDDLKASGLKTPIPLRTEQHPDGIPGLDGLNLVRLTAANDIYKRLASFVTKLVGKSRWFVIENPARSLFWQTSWIKPLFELPEVKMILYDACMFGGNRPKHQMLLTNISVLTEMCSLCDNNHEHADWSVKRKHDGSWKFDTASEAAYPYEFCNKLSAILAGFIHERAECSIPNFKRVETKPSSLLPITSLKQPRGHKVVSLVTEFQSHETRKFLSETDLNAFLKQNLSFKLIELRDGKESEGVEVAITAVLGKFWEKTDFVDQALLLEHPFRKARSTQDESVKAIFNLLTLGPTKFLARLKMKLNFMHQKMLALQEQERQLHAAMSSEVAKVLEGKNILLFKYILSKLHYPDVDLPSDMASGFKLTGTLKPTGIFEAEHKPAAISREELWSLAPSIKRSTMHMAGTRDADLDSTVFEETIKEVQQGWLEPRSREELDNKFGTCWIPVRRFGVVQGDKVRPVDNFKAARVNEALEQCEKLSLDSIDDYISIARCWLNAVSEEDTVMVTLSSGDTLEGTLHSEWRDKSFKSLFGKTFDLTSAYKQLARSPADAMFTTIAVFNPAFSELQFFESHALPFGATGSVIGFLRVSRALKCILNSWLEIPCISFFDDFPMIACESVHALLDDAFRRCMCLLGWKIAESEKKDRPFDKSFEPLGVQVNFPPTPEIVVANKPSRIQAVKSLIEELVSSKNISSKQAASIRGKLTFMEGQHLNRTLSMAMRSLSKVADSSLASVELDPVMIEELELAHKCLSGSKPRIVPAFWHDGEVLVFTDGAHEPGEDRDLVTCGGMIVAEHLGIRQFFRLVIPDIIVDSWMSTGRRQCIGQAEIFPILVAKILWKHFLNNRLVFFFVDNESAKSTLINRYSPVLDSSRLLWAVSIVDSELQCRDWFSRVASYSNPADEPSRLKKPLPELGHFDEVSVDPLDDDILRIILGKINVK